jgi:hypothetical protein
LLGTSDSRQPEAGKSNPLASAMVKVFKERRKNRALWRVQQHHTGISVRVNNVISLLGEMAGFP